MKVTKRQLRKLIRESYMKQLYGEIENMVLGLVDPELGNVHVDEMIGAWREMYPDLDIEQLWGVVEMMEANGQLEMEGSSGYYSVPDEIRGYSMNEAWMCSPQGFAPMKSRVDPEFAALIKGVVTEVVEDEEDDDEEVNPFGTGNTAVHDPERDEELIGHT